MTSKTEFISQVPGIKNLRIRTGKYLAAFEKIGFSRPCRLVNSDDQLNGTPALFAVKIEAAAGRDRFGKVSDLAPVTVGIDVHRRTAAAGISCFEKFILDDFIFRTGFRELPACDGIVTECNRSGAAGKLQTSGKAGRTRGTDFNRAE